VCDGSFVDFQGWLADEGSASRNAGRAAEGRIGYSGDASHGPQHHLPAGLFHIKKKLYTLYSILHMLFHIWNSVACRKLTLRPVARRRRRPTHQPRKLEGRRALGRRRRRRCVALRVRALPVSKRAAPPTKARLRRYEGAIVCRFALSFLSQWRFSIITKFSTCTSTRGRLDAV
jgi:hypothetical protein